MDPSPRKPIAARRGIACAERLESRLLLSAVLVKDIDQSPGSSDPSFLADVNGTLYFAARSGAVGNELWKSDGTAAGTTLVKDILPGFDSSNPRYLTNVAGTLFFWADDL